MPCRDFLGFCSVDDEVISGPGSDVPAGLEIHRQLDPDKQGHYLERPDSIHYAADDWGWGGGKNMDDLMAEYGFSEQ